MFVEAEVEKSITNHISYIQAAIFNLGKAGFSDAKVELEDFLCKLLNEVYDLTLVNLNQSISNYPAIDLGDTNKGLCYQVTVENEISKINDTKTKYNAHGLDKKYPNLKILIFANKPPRRDKIDGVEYVEDLLLDIKSLSLSKKQQLNTIIQSNLTIFKTLNISFELMAISQLMEFISTQKVDEDIDADCLREPLPDYKLNIRFKEYKEVIIEEYLDGYTNYENILRAAKSAKIDDGNSGKVKLFLRQISRYYLFEYEGDAKKALEALIEYLTSKIDFSFYCGGLRYYILSELMDCDIFPLSSREKESENK